MKEFEYNKQLKILFLTLYAILMLGSIWQEIDMMLFLLLFVIAPIGIYFYVKKIYPKTKTIDEK